MSQSEPSIPWPQVVNFIRQFNHDVRNYLNAVELQSANLGELVEPGKARDEVHRLREMTAEMAARLHRLSAQLAKLQPSTMAYKASEFVEDLRAKVTAGHPEVAAEIKWQISLGEETLEIDPQLLIDACAEIFANAFAHGRGPGPLVFVAGATDSGISLQWREPKAEPVEAQPDWGASPLARLRSGHYALGLFRARSIFEAHHGTFHAQFDPALSLLTTTVILPLAQN